MIRATRTYDEIAKELEEQPFTPSVLVFSDSNFGRITVQVSGITCGIRASVHYVAEKYTQSGGASGTSFAFPTLREAFAHIGIE